MSEILRADQTDMTAEHRLTPFSFESNQFDLNADGKAVLIALPEPEKVTWMIRSGTEVVWRSVSDAASAAWPAAVAWMTLPAQSSSRHLFNRSQHGVKVKALSAGGAPAREAFSRSIHCAFLQCEPGSGSALRLCRPSVAAQRETRRGSQESLAASLDQGATEAAEIELARVDALYQSTRLRAESNPQCPRCARGQLRSAGRLRVH